MEFTLNTELITLNEYIEAERKNRFLAANIKKSLTKKVAFLAKSQNVKLKDCLFDVEIIWYRKDKKHDPDNIHFAVKFILDGLVSAKILKNDGRKNIRDIAHKTRQSDTSFNYCTVKFKEVC